MSQNEGSIIVVRVAKLLRLSIYAIKYFHTKRRAKQNNINWNCQFSVQGCWFVKNLTWFILIFAYKSG